MAAVPLSAAYVKKLIKTKDPSPLQKKEDESVNHHVNQERPLLSRFALIHKISAPCHDQAVRVNIEKDDSSRSS